MKSKAILSKCNRSLESDRQIRYSLDEYCKKIGFSDLDFAIRFQIDRSHANRLRRKIVRPSAKLALRIHEWADGEITLHELLKIS